MLERLKRTDELAKLFVKENFAVGVSLKDLNKWVEVREHLLRD